MKLLPQPSVVFKGNVGEVHIPVDSSIQKGSASEEDDFQIFALSARKRKVTFEGVEILLANGTGNLKEKDFLQCSLCDLSLEKGSNYRDQTYSQMKAHILNTHKRTDYQPKAKRARLLGCVSCNISFSNYREFQAHQTYHPTPPPLECDICGKPLGKWAKMSHLYGHKFSHKNDVERQEAIALGEMGTSNKLLANNRGWGKHGSWNCKTRYGNSKKKQGSTARGGRFIGKTLKSPSVYVGLNSNTMSDGVMKLDNNTTRIATEDGSVVSVKQEILDLFLDV
ncbi:unnamed protein product [Orchesella dallaii]|uniref:C2H2-type domain-containing protein n=1 Tax=Orchesella dallaii TaxID=48710 RepID=A0ABP1RRW2_9HEXA